MGFRGIKELADLVSNRKIKILLSREEKEMIKELHLKHFKHKFTNTYCPPCWSRAIKQLAKHEEIYSEKMVVNEPKQVDYSKWKLKELRAEFPHIKAGSVVKFIEKLEDEAKRNKN